MTTTTKQNSRSAFAQAALDLDEDFSQFARMARELERLDIDSDKGLEKAQALLAHCEACGQRIGGRIQDLAQALNAAREEAEKAAQAIAARAGLVLERQSAVETMHARFRALGEKVRIVTAAVSQTRKPGGEALSAEDEAALAAHMDSFNAHMGVLIDEARSLMDDALAAHMKAMARNADSLRQTLQSAQHRLNVFVGRKAPT